MSAEAVVISNLAGMFLSLIVSYVPAAQAWYEKQAGKKAIIMLGLIALVSLAYFGMACTPFAVRLGITLSCNADGAVTLLLAFFQIAMANQATYLFTKKK